MKKLINNTKTFICSETYMNNYKELGLNYKNTNKKN